MLPLEVTARSWQGHCNGSSLIHLSSDVSRPSLTSAFLVALMFFTFHIYFKGHWVTRHLFGSWRPRSSLDTPLSISGLRGLKAYSRHTDNSSIIYRMNCWSCDAVPVGYYYYYYYYYDAVDGDDDYDDWYDDNDEDHQHDNDDRPRRPDDRPSRGQDGQFYCYFS